MTEKAQNTDNSIGKTSFKLETGAVVDWAIHGASAAYHEAKTLAIEHPVTAVATGLCAAAVLMGKGGLVKSAETLFARTDTIVADEHFAKSLLRSSQGDSLPALKIEGAGFSDKSTPLELAPKFVHVSDSPELNLKDIDPGASDKPYGLWFSPDHSWAKTALSSMPDKLGKYSFLVDTSKTNILKISTSEDLANLHRDYGAVTREATGNHSLIDWRKVRDDYDGIQFKNVQQHESTQPAWYKGLWVDSGSIWNASKVEVTPLGKMPSLEFEGHNLAEDHFELELEGYDLEKRDQFETNYLKQLEEQLRHANSTP
jgi:hypothetical protein